MISAVDSGSLAGARALGAMGPAGKDGALSVLRLIKRHSDDDSLTASDIADDLERVGVDALPAIREALNAAGVISSRYGRLLTELIRRIGPRVGQERLGYDFIKLPDMTVAQLIGELRSDDPYRRRAVYVRLSQLNEKASPAIPALLEQLASEIDSDRRRWYVEAALAHIGAAAVEPVSGLLKHRDWQVRLAALRTLEKIGTPPAMAVRKKFIANGYRL
jgi:HEAT repeat protein